MTPTTGKPDFEVMPSKSLQDSLEGETPSEEQAVEVSDETRSLIRLGAHQFECNERAFVETAVAELHKRLTNESDA